MEDNNKNVNDFSEFKKHAKDINVNPKKISFGIILGVLVIVLIAISSNFFYVVAEDEVATVYRFNEEVKVIVDRTNQEAEFQNTLDSRFKDVEIVKDKGIFFKMPFITTVRKDSSKLITYISQDTVEIVTNDKNRYLIAMYAQWEITHPGLFQASLGNITRANSKIDEIGYESVIRKINSMTSAEFLTDKEKLYEKLELTMNELNEELARSGITVRDIEVYRTILPASNIESTYKKMIAEREAIGQQKRSEGEELYQNTVADTDREVATILAKAIEESEQIRGEADAAALEIYAEAFSIDPEFYEFWRTLQSYEKSFDEDTVLFMDKNNKYLKYFSDFLTE